MTALQDQIDLARESRATRSRRYLLDLAQLDAIVDDLGVGEMIDWAEAAGIPMDRIAVALKTADAGTQARVWIALTWVIARRTEPTLPLAEVGRWHIPPTLAEVPEPDRPEPGSAGQRTSM